MTDLEDARTRADERRWREAQVASQKASLPSWPQAQQTARAMTDEQLVAAAQGCTELTCLYHGAINQALRERPKEQ